MTIRSYKHYHRVKDFDTTGSGFMFDPLKSNYNDLLAAIYKQAIFDVFQRNAYESDARLFLKKNPYGLNADFDGIIKKLRGGENEKN